MSLDTRRPGADRAVRQHHELNYLVIESLTRSVLRCSNFTTSSPPFPVLPFLGFWVKLVRDEATSPSFLWRGEERAGSWSGATVNTGRGAALP